MWTILTQLLYVVLNMEITFMRPTKEPTHVPRKETSPEVTGVLGPRRLSRTASNHLGHVTCPGWEGLG